MKMKTMKWIHSNNMPVKLPVSTTAVLWLLIDRLQPVQWLIGVLWTCMAILWIGSIICIVRSERLDEIK